MLTPRQRVVYSPIITRPTIRWPKGARVALFVAMWAWATADLGRPIIMADYLRYWPDEDETKVYRWQREFRQLFPEYRTPRELARPLAAAIRDAKTPSDLLTAQVAL